MTEEVRKFHRDFEYLKDVLVNWIKLIHLANPSSDSICLDVGCGSGAYSTKTLAQHVKKVIGIDIDKKAIEMAKKDIEEWKESGKEFGSIRNSKISLRVGNAEDLEFEDEYFDLVASRGGLRHCENWEKAYSECLRVLKPGGLFLLIEAIMPEELIALWKEIDTAQDRYHEHYWEYTQLISYLQNSPVEVLYMIPRRIERILEDYLANIKSKKIKNEFRKKVLNLEEDLKNRIGLFKSKKTFFYYNTLEIIIRKKSYPETFTQ